MAVLHVRFSFLRLLGLSGGVLIVDEVHAYDAYMSRILVLLLKWCSALEIPVILLSATLPALRKDDLVEAYTGSGGKGRDSAKLAAYPLLTFASRGREEAQVGGIAPSYIRNLRVNHRPGILGDSSATARLAWESAQHGGCVCVVANTVASLLRKSIRNWAGSRRTTLSRYCCSFGWFVGSQKKRNREESPGDVRQAQHAGSK